MEQERGERKEDTIPLAHDESLVDNTVEDSELLTILKLMRQSPRGWRSK